MSEAKGPSQNAADVAAVRALVKPYEGRLVPYAASCLLCLRDGSGVRMQTSQLRNFMAACNACDDPRLVQVWVMYQMSRSNDWRSMPAQPKDEKDMFGHRVVRLFAQPDGRIRQLANSLNDSAKPHRIELLQMQLLRAFAGQLARLHSYVEAKDGKKTISDWSMIEVLAKGADK